MREIWEGKGSLREIGEASEVVRPRRVGAHTGAWRRSRDEEQEEEQEEQGGGVLPVVGELEFLHQRSRGHRVDAGVLTQPTCHIAMEYHQLYNRTL